MEAILEETPFEFNLMDKDKFSDQKCEGGAYQEKSKSVQSQRNRTKPGMFRLGMADRQNVDVQKGGNGGRKGSLCL